SQQSQMNALEKRARDAEAQVNELRTALQNLEKDRSSLAGTLESREAALKAELTDKEQAWAAAKEALTAQAATFQRDAQQKQTALQSRISEPERRGMDAESHIQTLKEKLQNLEKE